MRLREPVIRAKGPSAVVADEWERFVLAAEFTFQIEDSPENSLTFAL
jgi:hypothetical protein